MILLYPFSFFAGELGIVFFLFEMGLELSVARLNAMKKDVFGLGSAQFLVTAAAGSAISVVCGLPTAAAITVGGSLALSSSAFVLQLLKDKDAMGTRYGKASFGILLLQDLAVVPLLVVVELLAKGGTGLGKALAIAGALHIILFFFLPLSLSSFLHISHTQSLYLSFSFVPFSTLSLSVCLCACVSLSLLFFSLSHSDPLSLSLSLSLSLTPSLLIFFTRREGLFYFICYGCSREEASRSYFLLRC